MAISQATIENMHDALYTNMKFPRRAWLLAMPLLLMLGCANDKDGADAYGNFEAKVVIVASETAGRLLKFDVEQGEELLPGAPVGLVDTMQVALQLEELAARRRQVGTRTGNVMAQIDVVKQQMEVLEKERARVEKLVAAGAATPKQLDDINGQLKVLMTQRQSISAQNLPVANELEALDIQAERLRDLLKRSHIYNPVKGRVLEKLAEETEVVAPGRQLYRIAPMDSLYLRAYMSGGQLSDVSVGQSVTVRIDNGEEGFYNYTGKVTWIADQAEFTPKIVQTKEERINLVYAFKVLVKNDGRLKIGMPGEVKFDGGASPAQPVKTAENK
jgi:HlyD family secretion protein